MQLLKWSFAIAFAGAVVTSAFAEEQRTTTVASAEAPAKKQTMREYCGDLVVQFNAADTHAVSAENLADAKDHASRGEMLCGTMPKTGVKELWLALKTIGVEPK
ncbi:MAG TPA: hypothetical protein VG891_02815 [Rhizomicrobium sp.]|nr:hypothetical protein [Rhizomicrobium sp.]